MSDQHNESFRVSQPAVATQTQRHFNVRCADEQTNNRRKDGQGDITVMHLLHQRELYVICYKIFHLFSFQINLYITIIYSPIFIFIIHLRNFHI